MIREDHEVTANPMTEYLDVDKSATIATIGRLMVEESLSKKG